MTAHSLRIPAPYKMTPAYLQLHFVYLLIYFSALSLFPALLLILDFTAALVLLPPGICSYKKPISAFLLDHRTAQLLDKLLLNPLNRMQVYNVMDINFL